MHKKTTKHSKFIYLLMIMILGTLFTQCSKEAPKVVPDPVVIHEFSAGDYVGVWNSTTATQTFENLPVSARIVELSDGNFEGTFYITDSFISCCGKADNDGSLNFKIEDNVVTSFKYDDTIPTCEGIFSGNGKLIRNNTIFFNMTGTDCDGNHSGNIRLEIK